MQVTRCSRVNLNLQRPGLNKNIVFQGNSSAKLKAARASAVKAETRYRHATRKAQEFANKNGISMAGIMPYLLMLGTVANAAWFRYDIERLIYMLSSVL